MSKIEGIARIPLFDGLSEAQLGQVAAIAVTKTAAKGERIFGEGEQAAGFYVPLSGRVKIFKISADGKEQILHIQGSGEPFGEVPVFQGGRFPANAEAMDDCAMLFFPRRDFVALIKAHPSLALAMLAVLSRKLRQFAALVDDLSLKEVPGRLAGRLLYLRQQADGAANITLDVSKSQLAGMLGTIPETLSRIIAKMTKQGLISCEGPNITIMDANGLSQLAEGTRRL